MCWTPNSDAARRYVTDDYRTCSNDRVVTNRCSGEHHSAGTDPHIVADYDAPNLGLVIGFYLMEIGVKYRDHLTNFCITPNND